MKKFVEWLKEQGYEVSPAGISSSALGVLDDGDGGIVLEDTDEEQPELLCWCLKELERRGYHWGVQPVGVKRYACLVRSPENEPYARFEAPTMTQAAIAALIGEPTP